MGGFHWEKKDSLCFTSKDGSLHKAEIIQRGKKKSERYHVLMDGTCRAKFSKIYLPSKLSTMKSTRWAQSPLAPHEMMLTGESKNQTPISSMHFPIFILHGEPKRSQMHLGIYVLHNTTQGDQNANRLGACIFWLYRFF